MTQEELNKIYAEIRVLRSNLEMLIEALNNEVQKDIARIDIQTVRNLINAIKRYRGQR